MQLWISMQISTTQLWCNYGTIPPAMQTSKYVRNGNNVKEEIQQQKMYKKVNQPEECYLQESLQQNCQT